MTAFFSSKRILNTISFLALTTMSLNSYAHKHQDTQEGSLAKVLASQSEEHKERYQYRNPQKTLEFFNIKPGMTVIEVLPGSSGWYSKILIPFLGKEGTLIGADYPFDIWGNFSYMTPERIEGKKSWVPAWIKDASAWRTDNSAQINAMQFGNMPESFNETADAVLYIRALHHLNRFDDKGGFLDTSLKESFKALKPGGILGVVQHQALEDRPDAWTNGDSGYMKKSYVLKKMAEYGFEFVASSDINANPKDLANKGDSVWRLLPSLRSKDPEVKAAMKAIGESNRMTLLFKKPLAK